MVDSILISTFISFPEAIIMLYLGFNLCNIQISIKRIVIIAVFQAIVSFAVDILNIKFGVHTIMLVVSLWIGVVIFYKIKFYKAIVPVLTGFFVDGIIQQILIYTATMFIDIDFPRLGIEFKYTFIYSLCLFVFSLIVLFIIKKVHFTLCDLSAEGEFVGE